MPSHKATSVLSGRPESRNASTKSPKASTEPLNHPPGTLQTHSGTSKKSISRLLRIALLGAFLSSFWFRLVEVCHGLRSVEDPVHPLKRRGGAWTHSPRGYGGVVGFSGFGCQIGRTDGHSYFRPFWPLSGPQIDHISSLKRTQDLPDTDFETARCE
jgi:hypothetical protein